MPDPREAVYDVLLAKKRRADEERAKAEQEREWWEQYELDNRRSQSAYDKVNSV